MMWLRASQPTILPLCARTSKGHGYWCAVAPNHGGPLLRLAIFANRSSKGQCEPPRLSFWGEGQVQPLVKGEAKSTCSEARSSPEPAAGCILCGQVVRYRPG